MSDVKKMDRKAIRDLVLEIYYDRQEEDLDRNDLAVFISQDKGIEFDVIDSAFKNLIKANLLEIVNGNGDVKITHLGINDIETSSMPSVDDSEKGRNFHIGGDYIIAGDNSTVSNRSSIGNSFNTNNSSGAILVKELAVQIDNLLKELKERNPNANEQQKVNYIDASIEPSLKERCLGMGRNAMIKYIEEFILENPLYKWSKVLNAALDGWQKG